MQSVILIPLLEGGSLRFAVNRSGAVKVSLECEGTGGRDTAEGAMNPATLRRAARSLERLAGFAESKALPQGCALEQEKAILLCREKACPCALQFVGA